MALIWGFLFPHPGNAEFKSQCYGEPHNGLIKHAVQLPKTGTNFKAYSRFGWYLGRTYVHEKVAAVVLGAYEKLYVANPKHTFVYGETGWPEGGLFKPHKTHQNGLSVDFMVPVMDVNNHPVSLPLTAANRYGYDLEFDQQGQGEGMRIDFELLASHIKHLHLQAKTHGIAMKRVILAPDLQPRLFGTTTGDYLNQHIKFNTNQAWVRHDEHYHVDFSVKCLPLKSL